MPERLKGRDQTNCRRWFYKLGIGRGDNQSTAEKFTVTKPWRRPRPTQGSGPHIKVHHYAPPHKADQMKYCHVILVTIKGFWIEHKIYWDLRYSAVLQGGNNRKLEEGE